MSDPANVEASGDHGRVGIKVTCGTCGRTKNPHARSTAYTHQCSLSCPGYYDDPKPGCLWPGEACAEFGCAHCHNATKEQEEGA